MKTATRPTHMPRPSRFQACFSWPLDLTPAEMEYEAFRHAEAYGFGPRRVIAVDTHHLSYYGYFPQTLTVVTVEVYQKGHRSNGNGGAHDPADLAHRDRHRGDRIRASLPPSARDSQKEVGLSVRPRLVERGQGVETPARQQQAVAPTGSDDVRIIGLDLSLAATGVARDEGVETIRYQMARAASELDRVVRLRDLGRLIDRICRDADVVVLEGHSFNSKNTHAHSLGELHGIVKVCLYQRGVPFVPIPPARLKRYATGRGNASKDEVLVAAARRSGHDFRDNNQADAWWLYQMACAAYSHTHRIVVPTRNTEALDGIEWPEIPVRKEAVGG